MLRDTVGCLEKVSIPSFGVGEVWAKVDTGAYSGALHCTNIKVVRRGEDRTRVLKFWPLGKKKLATETTAFQETFIRSASGHRLKRYVVDVEIVVRGQVFPVKIGLSDRAKMKRPVLIGRRFLRENSLFVDVRINQEYDDEGENTR
jgi:hypothetical protein